MLQVKSMVVGIVGTNCYIVYDKKSRDAVIIDPGAEAERILSFLEEEELHPQAILLTGGRRKKDAWKRAAQYVRKGSGGQRGDSRLYRASGRRGTGVFRKKMEGSVHSGAHPGVYLLFCGGRSSLSVQRRHAFLRILRQDRFV